MEEEKDPIKELRLGQKIKGLRSSMRLSLKEVAEKAPDEQGQEHELRDERTPEAGFILRASEDFARGSCKAVREGTFKGACTRKKH